MLAKYLLAVKSRVISNRNANPMLSRSVILPLAFFLSVSEKPSQWRLNFRLSFGVKDYQMFLSSSFRSEGQKRTVDIDCLPRSEG